MTKISREYVEKAFPVEYVANGFNGTQAYKKIRPNTDTNVAAVQANRLLRKDKTKKSIADLLPSDEYHRDIIKKALAMKPEQAIDWNTKHKYLRTSLELKGLLGDKPHTNVNIGLIIET